MFSHYNQDKLQILEEQTCFSFALNHKTLMREIQTQKQSIFHSIFQL